MFLESQIDSTEVVLKMTLNTKDSRFSTLAKCPPSSNADFDTWCSCVPKHIVSWVSDLWILRQIFKSTEKILWNYFRCQVIVAQKWKYSERGFGLEAIRNDKIQYDLLLKEWGSYIWPWLFFLTNFWSILLQHFCILFVSQRSLNMPCIYVYDWWISSSSGAPGGDVVQLIILLWKLESDYFRQKSHKNRTFYMK
jgi:hypothetical protein